MTIKRVTVRLIEREMSGALWNPRTRWTKKRILLVFVESSCGAVGCGEAWLTGGTPRAVIDTIEDDIAPRLVGEDPFFMRRLGETLFRSTEMTSPSAPRSLPESTRTLSPFFTFTQITSGASETMRMKRFSRSSRPTGPKMRVPRGFRLSSMSTAAFSSKRM